MHWNRSSVVIGTVLCLFSLLCVFLIWHPTGSDIRNSLVSTRQNTYNQGVHTRRCVVVIHFNNKDCWRTLSLLVSLRKHGWDVPVCILTDKADFPWKATYSQLTGDLDADHIHMKVLNAPSEFEAKACKYRVFEFFPRFTSFVYIDSDILMNADYTEFTSSIYKYDWMDESKIMVFVEPSTTMNVGLYEIFHSGFYMVQKTPTTVSCFQEMSRNILDRQSRDQRILTDLYKKGVCQVETIRERSICFPSAEKITSLDMGDCDMIHFTSGRRGLVNGSTFEALWDSLGLQNLYENPDFFCNE